MIVTPNTELEAVNEILTAVGSSPVNSLDDDVNVDIINARAMLRRVSREIQSKGWEFNLETNVLLDADIFSLHVAYLDEYIRVVGDTRLVRRNDLFYDLDARTNRFPAGVTLRVLIREVPFDDLPEAVRLYVTARAARIFQSRYLSSGELDAELQQSEEQARSDLLDYELEYGNYNVYNSDTFISQQTQR